MILRLKNDKLKSGITKRKTSQHKDLVDYFPKDISGLVEKKFESSGINAAIALYKDLKETAPGQYNFKNNSVINLTIKWIDNGKVKKPSLF